MADGGEDIEVDPTNEDIDFDPLEEDGMADINDELDPLLKDKDLGEKSWMKRFREFFSKRGRDMSDRELKGYERLENEGNDAYRTRLKQNVQEYKMSKLKGREGRMGSAAEEVKKLYPKWDPKEKLGKDKIVLVEEDEFGRVTLKLGKKNSTQYFLDEPEEFPPTMKKTLGGEWNKVIARNEEVRTDNERTIERNEEEIERLEESNDPNDRKRVEEIRRENEELERENEAIDGENEAILEKVPLKERIKEIFEKAGGITVASVLAATLVVVGVILAKLKAGLSAMRRYLKELSKKRVSLLPGLIGSIVSFLFKTAGEVVGFVVKNAWLLILAVVVYVIEQYKNKKNKRK